LLTLQLLSTTILYGIETNPLGLLLIAVADILSSAAGIFTWSIIILVVLSWLQPQTSHPGISLLNQLTDPIMQPVQRLLPATGGFDFSPILALFAIKLAEFIMVAPLKDFAAIMIR